MFKSDLTLLYCFSALSLNLHIITSHILSKSLNLLHVYYDSHNFIYNLQYQEVETLNII